RSARGRGGGVRAARCGHGGAVRDRGRPRRAPVLHRASRGQVHGPMSTSRQLQLAARPVGEPRSSDFELVEEQVPEPADGEFVVAVTHISVDPAMRGWMSAAPSYLPPVEIGEAMRALAL